VRRLYSASWLLYLYIKRTVKKLEKRTSVTQIQKKEKSKKKNAKTLGMPILVRFILIFMRLKTRKKHPCGFPPMWFSDTLPLRPAVRHGLGVVIMSAKWGTLIIPYAFYKWGTLIIPYAFYNLLFTSLSLSFFLV